MIEIWKDVPGYEGHYQVSNLGKVRQIKGEISATFKGTTPYTKSWQAGP